SDHVVFVATATSGVFRSTDGGSSWSALPGTAGMAAVEIELSPAYRVDQSLFIATANSGLWKSTDGGATMTRVPVSDTFITAVAVSPAFASDRTVVAAGYRGLYKSLDGGVTWFRIQGPARLEEQTLGIRYDGDWSFTSAYWASTWGLAVSASPQASM